MAHVSDETRAIIEMTAELAAIKAADAAVSKHAENCPLRCELDAMKEQIAGRRSVAWAIGSQVIAALIVVFVLWLLGIAQIHAPRADASQQTPIGGP